MSDEHESYTLNFGDITGGIHGSNIAGRNVTITTNTITINGQPTPVDKQPTSEELKQLLAEIQQELAKVIAQKEALAQVSSAAPYTIQGADASLKDAAAKTEGEVGPEQAQSVQKSLSEATGILTGILNGAKEVAETASGVGQAVKPLADILAPLVTKLGVAALWAGKLWLGLP